MNGFGRQREKIILREVAADTVTALAGELSVPYPLARTFCARNLSTFEQCRSFFTPDIAHFHDPFLFNRMEKAVERIMRAVSSKEPIAVYGDYDVDGVTATALMIRVLRMLGANCFYYLPNRLVEGYGLSEEGIDKIADRGATLMITVDCGISSVREVMVASCRGIDTIITDHHELHGEIPAAYAVLDPKESSCGYPYRHLAGVGVAFKLCQALAIYSKKGSGLWEPYIDIVALGTAADIVPLTEENRIIAHAGFIQMQHTINKGLRELLNKQGLGGKQLSTSQIVFQIAPCINASGRLGDSYTGVDLLLTEDDTVAREYAEKLRNANMERRLIDRAVAEEAYQWVEDKINPTTDMAIVAGSQNWHVGVIGIVASKLVERYHRPTILFSIGNDGYARGSGRSIRALNLLEALNGCADLLEGYGGHAAAAGMSIKVETMERFRERFNDLVCKMVVPEDFIPVVIADAEASLPMLTPKFYRIIKRMEPFGPGNMRPVFISRNVKHRASPRLAAGNHVKMSLAEEGVVMDAIAFNCGDRFDAISNASSLTVAYTLDQNEWNGKTSLQMNVKGILV